MKSVYVAFIDGRISAFHNSKSIIKDYLRKYKDSNPKDKCYIGKMTRETANQMHEYHDFYLEEAEDGNLVQQKYMDAYLYLINTPEKIREIHELIEGIEHTLQTVCCTKKQRRKLVDSLETLLELETRYQSPHTPSMHELDAAYWMLEEFRYKTW